MSDKKNEFETDFEEKWAKIASQKSRRHSKDSIYQRFISRIQHTAERESDNTDTDTNTNTKKVAATESLTANEFELFNDDHYNNDHKNESDHHKEIAAAITDSAEIPRIASDTGTHHGTDAVTQEPPASAVKKSTSSKNRHTSGKKLFIVGVIVGSLLMTAIVATLIFSGFLSMATKSDMTDMSAEAGTNLKNDDANSDANSANNDAAATQMANDDGTAVISAVSVEPLSANNGTPSAADTNVNTTVKPMTAPQNDSVNSRQNSTDKSTAANRVDEVATSAPNASNLQTEAAITYEDFRQESQNTLYRENQ